MRQTTRENTSAINSPTPPLRLVIYDGTQTGRGPVPGLSVIWAVGTRLYRALGWVDAFKSGQSWEDALGWVAEVQEHRPIGEIQFWMHGRWGCVRMGGYEIGTEVLAAEHPLNAHLRRIRDRLLPDAGSLLWFRTCETFGAESGHLFAAAWAEFFRCRVAGHTHVIHFFQSGLQSLSPGESPRWPVTEGLAAGTASHPRRARVSKPWAPNTVTCLHHTTRDLS